MDQMAARVAGRYRWLEDGGPSARIAGEIPVFRGPGDLFWQLGGVKSFRGRIARLEIAGVGLSPVRIYSNGASSAEGWSTVTFEAWMSPVPMVAKHDLADALRTPIADALEEAGHADLANLARAAAVALVGFPRTIRRRKDDRS